MALQNIGARNKNDAFYRYKMPRLITKIEGRGNGVKTNLVNIVDVAKALARSPAYITKFYGCELGAQSKFDDKTGSSTVNGAHETAKLVGLLEIFINKYVQCYGCGNPETEVVVAKSQMITLKCAACGFTSNVDMRDKLTTFILKHPPSLPSAKKKELRKAEIERLKEGEPGDRARKEPKKRMGKDNGKSVSMRKANASPGVDELEVAEEEVQWETDTSVKAAQQRIKEQLSAVTRGMAMLNRISDDDDDDKENDQVNCLRTPTKKSSSSRILESANQAGANDPGALGQLDPQNKLLKDFQYLLESGYNSDQLVAHLKVVCPQIAQQEVMNAYFEALFNGFQKGLAKEIPRKRLFLTKAVTNDTSQVLLLGAVEAYYNKFPESSKEVAVSLKVMYDLEIIDEDVVLVWYEQGSHDEVKERAKPFVEWLQNAESEED